MPRIRTIKPEFPQSESMGRVSRDARLLFVELWTLCDDYGRSRANSRALASLLFPYDDDAPTLIQDWFVELEREGCVFFYEHDGQHYLQIENWDKHQRVDHRGTPQFPAPRENSRTLATTSRALATSRARADQGPRSKEGTKEGKDSVPTEQHASRANGGLNGSPPEHVAAHLRTDPAGVAPLTPADLRREAWRTHVAYLGKCGIKDRRARELIGRWCKASSQGVIIDLLGTAEVSAVVDVVPWMEAAIRNRAGSNGHKKNGATETSDNVSVGTVAWYHQQVKHGIFNDEERSAWGAKLGIAQ